jgi:hypothetical protein
MDISATEVLKSAEIGCCRADEVLKSDLVIWRKECYFEPFTNMDLRRDIWRAIDLEYLYRARPQILANIDH